MEESPNPTINAEEVLVPAENSLEPTVIPTAETQGQIQPVVAAPQTVPQAHFAKNKLLRKIVLISAVMLLIIALLAGGTLVFRKTHKAPLTQAQRIAQIRDQSVKISNEIPNTSSQASLRDGVNTLYVNGDVSAQGQLSLGNGSAQAQLSPSSLTNSQSYLLPNASGTICLSSNNCGFATTGQVAQIVQNSTSGVASLQGTAGQVLVNGTNGRLTLALPQSIAITSTPEFSSIRLTNQGSQNGSAICDASNNCGFASSNSTLLQGGNSFASSLVLGTLDANSINLVTNGSVAASFSSAGQATFGASTNSTTAFSVVDASSQPLFTVDTTNRVVSLGASSTSPTVLALGVSTSATDPAGVPGAIYFNSALNKFRCFQVAWIDCVASGSGSGDVNNGGNSYGSTMTLGTLDNQDLHFITHGNSVASFSASDGSLRLNNSVDSANALAIYDFNNSSRLTVSTLTDQTLNVSGGIQVSSQAALMNVQNILTSANASDAAVNRITGNIDLRARISPTSWNRSLQPIIQKFNGSGVTVYGLTLSANKLRFIYSLDGTTTLSYDSNANLPFVDGSVGWVRATYSASTGQINFYTASDQRYSPTSWAALGTVQTGTAGNIYAGNGNVRIGGLYAGQLAYFFGDIYEAQAYNGINGSLAFDFWPADTTIGSTGWTAGRTGEAWNTVSTARILGAPSTIRGALAIGAPYATSLLTVNAPTTADYSAQAMISSKNSNTKALVLQQASSQAASLLENQSPNGVTISGFNANGGLFTNGISSSLNGIASPSNYCPLTCSTMSPTGGTLATGTYYYSVTAVSVNGIEAVPAANVSLTASTNTSSANLTWATSPGAALYIVYRSTSPDFKLAQRIGYTAGTTFVDTGYALGGVAPPTSSAGSGLTIQGWSNQSTNALQVQDVTGANFLTVATGGAGGIQLLSGVSGETSAWSTDNNLPNGAGQTTVTANGYIYSIGGFSTGSTTSYAKLNSDGTIGSWQTSTNSLPTDVFVHTSVIVNGYVYVMGGVSSYDQPNNIATASNEVYFAKLNSDGSTGVWKTSTNNLPASLYGSSAVTSNGYIYVMGGQASTSNASTTNSVYYAKVNASGTTGNWLALGNLPAKLAGSAAVVANGYIYLVGGSNESGAISSVIFTAKLNSDGTLGSWTASANSLPAARAAPSALVLNGYLYVMGGVSDCGALLSCATGTPHNTVYFAKLTNGAMSTWKTSQQTLPGDDAMMGAVTSNGYLYTLGSIQGGGIYSARSATVTVGGNLDLVGVQGGNLADGGSQSLGSLGGSLTAGNGTFVGSLQVQGATNLSQSLTVNGDFNAAGSALLQNSIDSTNAFQVMNSASDTLLNIDTTNRVVSLGPSSTTPTLLTLGVSSSATDPTGIDGSMYYNANLGKFRCYANGAWANCTGGGGVGTGDVNNGGNNYGSTMTLGTLDANNLNIITNNSTVATFGHDGFVGINNNAPTNRLNINVPTTASSTAQLMVATGGSTNIGIVVQGATSQTADLQQNQASNGSVLSGIDANGGLFTNGVGSSFRALAAPTISSLTASTTGGSLPAATYYYGVTAVNAAGTETALGQIAQNVTTTGSTGSVAITWGAVAGAVKYNLYRATWTKFTTSSLLATVDNANTYTDTGLATTAGRPSTTTPGSGLNLQAWDNQAGNILQVQNASGNTLTSIGANGSLSVTGGATLAPLAPVAIAFNGLTSSFNLSTPDAPVNRLTGDMSAAVHATLTNWANGATYQALIGKYSTTPANGSFLFEVSPTGYLQLLLSNGSSYTTVQSTVPVGLPNGASNYVYFTRDATTGVVAFFMSGPGRGAPYMQQVGANVAGPTGPINVGNNSVQLGGYGTSGDPLQGRIFRAQLFSDVARTNMVLDMNPADAGSIAATTWSSYLTGETWTISGSSTMVGSKSQVTVSSNDNATAGITIQGAVGQSANFLQAVNNSGSSLFYIDYLGGIHAQGESNGIGGIAISGSTLAVFTKAVDHVGITIRGATGQTANLQEWQDNSFNVLAQVSNSGVGSFANLLQNGGKQVCDNSNNCGFLTLNPSDYTLNGVVYYDGAKLVSTGSGNSGQCLAASTGLAPNWTSCSAGGGSGTGDINQGGNSFGSDVTLGATDGNGISLLASNHAVASFSSSGQATLQNTADSNVAFQIQNAAGTSLFTADTANSVIYIGNPTPDATGTLLVLDNKNTSGDPAGIDGAMYYNSALGRFRCYEAGVWLNCVSGSQQTTKSATQAFSGTTYSNVNDLSFSVLTGKSYRLTCSLLLGVPSSTGAYLSMSAPGGQFTATYPKTGDQTAGDNYATSNSLLDPSPSSISKITSQTGSRFILNYSAVLSGVTSNGSWQLVARSADGTAINIYANSSCTLQPL